MSKPIIAITPECVFEPETARSRGTITLNWNYAEEVAKAGGVPLIIPPTADMAAIAPLIDGWLIPGGNDIDASRWGEENHPSVVLQDPHRFESEAALYAEVKDTDLPILGICYGCQFLNVSQGGSLIQDLPSEGREGHSGGPLEPATIHAGSRLASVVQQEVVQGRSYHHQAVGRVGEGLKVVSHHADGTVEAVEGDGDRWMIGVQWHPERTPDDAATQRLFLDFIEAARQYRARKAR